jgi:hypothetical protein
MQWRDADDPRGAQVLCEALCDGIRYEHSRGVAQQATRAAGLVQLPVDERRRLLCAAWLHDVGYGLPGGYHPTAGARALRLAGHEELARLVAHHSSAALRAQMLGLPSVEAEFPLPVGPDRGLLDLLDVSDLTTGPHGERIDPATRLRGVADRHGPDSPSVRMLVANVNRLGAQPDTRSLVEILSSVTSTA